MSTLRLPDPDTKQADPLCLLVSVGVRLDGTKELVAVATAQFAADFAACH
jgi:hypothetical protein